MKFPQISRFFSAILFLSLIGLLFGLNTYITLNQQAQVLPQEIAVLRAPRDTKAHKQLAQTYWLTGDLKQATRELTLAGDVLGVSLWESERAQKETTLDYWQSVSQRHPNYRDAYVTIGTLNYELGNWSDAKSALARAISLDQYLIFPQQLLSLMD